MDKVEDVYLAEPLEFLDINRGNVSDPLEIERPPSTLRKFVEFIFYFITILTTFPYVFELGKIRFMLGSIYMLAGLLSFAIVKLQGEKLPATIWFAIIINICANMSQVFAHGDLPIIGEGLALHFHWLSTLIMVCYVMQNDAASKRILLFYSVLVIVTVWLGGTEYVTAGRLELKTVEFGVSFSNACQLGVLCGFLAVACLFWSLWSPKVLRPFLWALSALLVYILFRTVTRSAVLLLVCGLMVLVIAILMGRGVRLSGIFLTLVAIVIVSEFAYLLTPYLQSLTQRMEEAGESSRLRVYNVETLYELSETMVFGKGPATELKYAGISPHNSFVNLYLSFGGITAWPYAVWILVLFIRVLKMMRFKHLPLYLKLSVVALFGMALGENIFSNGGYLSFPTIYAVALVEKYTAPYTKQRIRKRATAQQDYYAAGDELSLDAVGDYTDGSLV